MSSRQKRLESGTRLIVYLDKTEEGGDPSEADSLLGAPTTTLGDWIQIQKGKERIRSRSFTCG